MARYYQRRDTKVPSMYVPLPLEFMQKQLTDAGNKLKTQEQSLGALTDLQGEYIQEGTFGSDTLDAQYVKSQTEAINKKVSETATKLASLDKEDWKTDLSAVSREIMALKTGVDRLKSGDFKQTSENKAERENVIKALDAKGYSKNAATAVLHGFDREYEGKGSFKNGDRYNPYNASTVGTYVNPQERMMKYAGMVEKDGSKVGRSYVDPATGEWVYHDTNGVVQRTGDRIIDGVKKSFIADPESMASLENEIRGDAITQLTPYVKSGQITKEEAEARVDAIWNREQEAFFNINSEKDLAGMMDTRVGTMLAGATSTFKTRMTERDRTMKANPNYGGGGGGTNPKGMAAFSNGKVTPKTADEFKTHFKDLTARRDASIAITNKADATDEEKLDAQNNALATELEMGKVTKLLRNKFQETLKVSSSDMANDYKNATNSDLSVDQIEYNILTDPDFARDAAGQTKKRSDSKVDPLTKEVTQVVTTGTADKYEHLARGLFDWSDVKTKYFTDEVMASVPGSIIGNASGSAIYKNTEDAVIESKNNSGSVTDINGNIHNTKEDPIESTSTEFQYGKSYLRHTTKEGVIITEKPTNNSKASGKQLAKSQYQTSFTSGSDQDKAMNTRSNAALTYAGYDTDATKLNSFLSDFSKDNDVIEVPAGQASMTFRKLPGSYSRKYVADIEYPTDDSPESNDIRALFFDENGQEKSFTDDTEMMAAVALYSYADILKK